VLFSLCVLFSFLLPEIKVNELQKRQEIRNKNIILNKTVHKEAKKQEQKQKTGNKEHNVD